MPETKPQKRKGPIRWEAILPFTIIIGVTVFYFHFFFDLHMKKALEFIGYKVMGAEVDINDFDTSFFKASLHIQGIEITNAQKPSHNSVSVGDVRFSLLWDALLRARFVINEVAVEQIEFGKPRKAPGRVKPPEPPPSETEKKPSALQREAEKLKNEAIEKTQSKYSENVLGDVANVLGGSNTQVQMDKIEGTLLSKEMAQKLESDINKKQEAWKQRLASLPQGKEFQTLNDRLNKVKIKDFKSVDELQNSLKELDSIFKDADSKFKQIQSANSDFNQDIQLTEKQMKDLENQIQADIKSLESRFRIPQLDPKSLSVALFRKYLDPYLAQFYHYKAQAEKYIPPNLMKKTKKEPDLSMQPRSREKGVIYEFGQPNAYPMFWIKKISISSQAGKSAYSGNIKGLVTDITSNQLLTGKPTIADISGDFPAVKIFGFSTQLNIDNRQEKSSILFNSKIESYPIEEKDLVKSDDVQIAFRKAQGSMLMKTTLVGLTDFNMDLDNRFSQIDYNVTAKNEAADSILKGIFRDIPLVTLNANGRGELPNLALNVSSNLGGELERGIQKQLQAKVKEARDKIEKYVNDQIGPQKAQIEAQYKQIKGQVEKELKKLNDQADSQKKTAENKTDQAKKDSENQAKKSIEKDAKKAAEDLKKKLGW